jgi:hypothetical protein
LAVSDFNPLTFEGTKMPKTVVPARPGDTAILICCKNETDPLGRPDESTVERVAIVAWRVEVADDRNDWPTPVLASPRPDYTWAFLEHPDGRLEAIEPDGGLVCESLVHAKRHVLARHQDAWDTDKSGGEHD